MSVRLLRTILIVGLIVAIVGAGIALATTGGARVAGVTIAMFGVCVMIMGVMPMLFGDGLGPREPEPDNINDLGEDRLRELMRGTSLYLRNMKYRYSVRLNTSRTADRRPFSAEVNTIHLGFIPAVITDNTNDRQGYGFVAFVYDGSRWRGPGLPCPADQAEAVRHAARCVSPLAKEEETTIGG